MSLDENKAIIRKMIEAFNKRDLASLDKLIAPGYIDHYHQLRSLEKYKQFGTMLLKAFPDWQIGMRTLRTSSQKGTRFGFVSKLQGHTQANLNLAR